MGVESSVPAVDVECFAGRALRAFVSFLVGEARVGDEMTVGRASECLWGMSYGSSGHSQVLVMNSLRSPPIQSAPLTRKAVIVLTSFLRDVIPTTRTYPPQGSCGPINSQGKSLQKAITFV